MVFKPKVLRAPRSKYHTAIIGSGPSGFYTANKLLELIPSMKIDIFEKLPCPYGLVRYGVAPDHPEVKLVINKFKQIALKKNVRFFGNVELGKDLSLIDIQSRYDATILAFGANEDKQLNIEGESLNGVITAQKFVSWYNGFPDNSLIPPLDKVESICIFGNGNVSLDIARILLKPVELLKNTDITENAINILQKSKVKEVNIIGRRGPLEAAFTAKELRELINLDDIDVLIDKVRLEKIIHDNNAVLQKNKALKRLMDLLLKSKDLSEKTSKKCLLFTFFNSPLKFNKNVNDSDLLSTVDICINQLSSDRNIVNTTLRKSFQCDLAIKSIGYKISSTAGLEINQNRVSNKNSRVLIDNEIIPYLYVSGWLKTGPVGIIATTLIDANDTAYIVASDLKLINPSGKMGFTVDYLNSKGIDFVTFNDWIKIEAEEMKLGIKNNKSAEKITSTNEIFKILKRG